jgi:hypothetical protein
VVLAAAVICLVSFLVAPERGWLARRLREAGRQRQWTRGRLLEECLAIGGDAAATPLDPAVVLDRAAGDAGPLRRAAGRAWEELVRDGSLELAGNVAGGGRRSGAAAVGGAGPPQPGRDRWRLSAAGIAQASERRRRIEAWRGVLDAAVENGRDSLTLDLPAPEAVLDPAVLAAAALAPGGVSAAAAPRMQPPREAGR